MKHKKNLKYPLHDIVGWYGSFAIVGGYFLSSFGVISSHSIVYQVVNLTGALGLFYLGFKRDVKESMFLNGFWILIACVSLVRIVL